MWVKEAEEVASSEEFSLRHKSGGSPWWLIDEVVPRVYVMLPKGSEALQYVVCAWVGLGVEKIASVIGDWLCGSGERLRDLAAVPDRWSASGKKIAG